VRAEILTIGDELLRGEIIDSNKSLLSGRLLGLDVETHWHSSVRDDPAEMTDAFRRAVGRADVVLVSGGLGPTRDDLTSEVLARSFGRKLVLDEAALDTIRAFFHGVGREMTENNAKQAFFPEGAEVLPNPIGTAPGFVIEEQGTLLFCMPGVPRELERMLDEQVLPRLAARLGSGGTVVRARLLRTFGMGESTLDAELADLATGPDVSLGFRTAFPDNYLRPVVRAASAEEAEARLAELCRAIRERLGPLVYGEGEQTLALVVGHLLRGHGQTLAVAESCTGGLVAQLVTEVPGASDYFLGGVVAYSNEAKCLQLGVPGALLEEHGAVSEPVARAMAEGVRTRFGADLGVATTGISGPTGGSPGKPVGLVHVALARDAGTHADHFVFPLDRTRHRLLTAQVALDWVRRALLGFDLVGPTLLRRKGGASTPAQRAAGERSSEEPGGGGPLPARG
jgi:nicotinamide-nucleotide amidase